MRLLPRVLKGRYINHWELPTLLLGDQKGRPGVTAASPMWEPEPELGFSPLPSGGVLGGSVLFYLEVSFPKSNSIMLLIQKMTRKPVGFMWLSLLHVSRKFTEVSESISGLLVSGHPWGRGRGEDSEDSPG